MYMYMYIAINKLLIMIGLGRLGQDIKYRRSFVLHAIRLRLAQLRLAHLHKLLTVAFSA